MGHGADGTEGRPSKTSVRRMPPHNLTSFVKCCASAEDFPPLF